ncbi:carbohydrate ABC transporter permease [Leucobacter luti]|uniref:Carbohydrate ABC transporter membrane protein 1 (CUT1 family) n=1 Tax=Leucobacter luti TaxID=340320 RepID=A0A4V6PVM3_9MICO|nr:sugar ABC transporter permease [Leucobacter luti]MCW2289675.1 N,N'-diacetylchitobiose transport system permease protein [Leucobacter luti]QYM77156.1 sugar ABC transporter permease [Leucobacter luti]TCK37846.1 carbohydrate ABC transporter membrane protein 1 (CUT1 family) [Leucobacter luti]TDP90838.1 carbohydrate ABC transporter membrane protein 1 (CUT1 family) [Leucobacter luti]
MTTSAPPATQRRRFRLTPYALLLPATLIVLLALGYPIIWQLITSMQHFGLAQQFGSPPEWVWFSNYIELFTNPTTWLVVARSVAFCLITAGVTMIIGVGLALLMQAIPTWIRISLQIALLLAWATPVVAAMTIWNWIFDWRRGLVNWVLSSLGFPVQGHNWLQDPLSFFAVAMIIVVWMSVPFVAFSVYAALTQVPGEVLEAAQMDGASHWQRLRYIILPVIKPILGIVMLLQIIWNLRVFTQIKLLQDRGSIASQTDVLGTYIYQLGVGSSDFAMASAMSIFVLLLTIALSWAYVRNLVKEDEQP